MTRWGYEVQVVGTMSEDVLSRIEAEVGPVRATAQGDTTVVSGSVEDQSALIGLLDLMHALGLKVCELRSDVDASRGAGGASSSGSDRPSAVASTADTAQRPQRARKHR